MTNTETFKSKFPGFKGVVNFYTLGNEQINFIDVDADRVEYTYTYTSLSIQYFGIKFFT